MNEREAGMQRAIRAFILGIALLSAFDSAAQNSMLTLSCDGVMKNARSAEDVGERIANLGLVVDLTKRTVSGLGGIITRIDRVDDAGISFFGSGDLSLGGRPIGV